MFVTMIINFSKQGAYLAACMHFLAIYGPGTTVVGNPYFGGLDASKARQIQVQNQNEACHICISRERNKIQCLSQFSLAFQEVAEAVWYNGENWDYPTDGSCNISMC